MRSSLSLCALALLCACPPAAPRCEADSGTPASAADAGAPGYDVQLRVVNLGREAVRVRLDGEDGGQLIAPLSSLAKTGHITLIKQRGFVEARNFLEDGGRENVTLPFEFDADGDEPLTVVVKDTTPARSSMNVTVAKQTQGATFGERMQQGLAGVSLAAGVDTDGDCLADAAGALGSPARVSLRDEPPPPGDADCPGTADDFFVRPAQALPESTPYFVRGPEGALQVAWVGKANAGLHAAGSAVARGPGLLGNAVPGAGIVSAAIRSLYVLNAHRSGLEATVSIEGVEVARGLAPGALVRVRPALVAAVARKGLNDVNVSLGRTVVLSVGAETSSFVIGGGEPRCQSPLVCDFDDGEATLLVVSENPASSATVLKSRDERAWRPAANVRRQIAFATTSSIESHGCVHLFAGDDSCAVGAAVVGAVAPVIGGPSSSAYAATGRLLYPPLAPDPQGTPTIAQVDELGVVARRFTFADPPGLTPVAGKTAGGFAIVAAGTVLDATAVDQRALFFVDTSVSPWTVSRALSR